MCVARRAGLVATVVASPGAVLLTTYDQLRLNRDTLLPVGGGLGVLQRVWRPVCVCTD